eukprot:symbB.v1.2.015064.t1/scaffold1116.1/size136988/7
MKLQSGIAGFGNSCANPDMDGKAECLENSRPLQTCANGQANAGCPSPFFGDFCQKERVQFVSHDGLCVGTAANSAVCKGLAIAATSEDWQFCNPEQDCTTWNEVKKVVITIYECELGDFFADLLGFFGTLMCVILSCRCCRRCCCSLDAEELQKYVLVPQATTFIADLSLEWLVVQNVGAAARSIETVKESYCMSQGAGYDSMVLLLDQTDGIRNLAYGSSTAIAIAVPKLHGGYEIAAPKPSNPDGTYGASIQIPVPNLDDTHPDGHCPRISIPIIPLVNMDGHPAIAIAMPNLDGEGYEIQRHPKGGHVAVPNFDVEGIQGIASSVFCTGSACQGSNWWR